MEPQLVPRHEPEAAEPEAMLIDELLPEFDVTEIRHVVANAPIEVAYRAVHEANLLSGRVARALFFARQIPEAIRLRLRGETPERIPETITFAEITGQGSPWNVLGERPGREIVAGSIGEVWRPVIRWRAFDVDEFAPFDERGYAKLAVSISLRHYGARRTLISYEARTATTDARARRRFAVYWRLMRPEAGFVMQRALDAIKRRAEWSTPVRVS